MSILLPKARPRRVFDVIPSQLLTKRDHIYYCGISGRIREEWSTRGSASWNNTVFCYLYLFESGCKSLLIAHTTHKQNRVEVGEERIGRKIKFPLQRCLMSPPFSSSFLNPNLRSTCLCLLSFFCFASMTATTTQSIDQSINHSIKPAPLVRFFSLFYFILHKSSSNPTTQTRICTVRLSISSIISDLPPAPVPLRAEECVLIDDMNARI